MKLTQKLSLAAFLCISLVMAITALIRIGGIKVNGVVDLNWAIYWQYMEGCLACIMASVIAFRTLFVNAKEKPYKPLYSIRQHLLKMNKRSKDSNGTDMENQDEGLPEIPRATLSGMRTFIRRNNRTAGSTTVGALSTLNSFDEQAEMRPKSNNHIYVNDCISVESNRVCLKKINVRCYSLTSGCSQASLHLQNLAVHGANFL